MLTNRKDFMDACTRLREQTTNCDNSRTAFAAATSIPEAVTAFRQFWLSVVEQIPQEFIHTLFKLYPRYHKDINAAGVYFNESPDENINNALVFVGGDIDIPDVIFPYGRMLIIVVTKAKVTIGDHIRCRCYSDEAEVKCTGHSRLTLERGTAYATDRSNVIGIGEIHTSSSATVRIYGGTLHDGGHLDIQAFNDAKIYSTTDRNITLHDHSQLFIL